MSDLKYSFQYCQKLVVFSTDWQNVLLARRKGEADYDETFSFIGGKMEISDESIADGLRRERDEEVGPDFILRVQITASYNAFFQKKDGSRMILPHYVSQHVSGDIRLNKDEYSEYQWVPVKDIESFGPKVENIPEIVLWAFRVAETATGTDRITI